jgi:phosphomannomutase
VVCVEGEPARVVQALQARVADGSLRFEGGEVSTIDGVRVDWPDGFGLIRGSNTTPVLVLRFEGHTKKALARIEREFMAALKAVKPDAVVGAGGH